MQHSRSKEWNPPGGCYRPVGVALLRAPLLAADTFFAATDSVSPVDHIPTNDPDGDARTAALALASRPEVLRALAVATPALSDALSHISTLSGRRAARVRSSVLSYLVRMCTRPTPFGLFAGVAPVHLAERTDATIIDGALEKIRARPDMGWLYAVLRTIEADPDIAKHIPMKANESLLIAGDRVVLPCAETSANGVTQSVSLRFTPAVKRVLDTVRNGASSICDLADVLREDFPHAPLEQVERLLEQLRTARILVSDLRPPLTSDTPIDYVIDRLKTIPGAQEYALGLDDIRARVVELDCARTDEFERQLRETGALQRVLLPTDSSDTPHLQIDAKLAIAHPRLHRSIGQVAAETAEILLRMSIWPQGVPYLQEYRHAFLERYGSGAEIPVLDLLSPDVGLDVPPTYSNPPRTYPLRTTSVSATTHERDSLLCQLVVEAVNQHDREIELTDDLLHRLEQWAPDRGMAPTSLEIYFQIHAASADDIDQGKWLAVLSANCGAPAAGRTFGRFFGLLGDQGLNVLHSLAKQEEALEPDVAFADLSYVPTRDRTANVATHPFVRSYEITIGAAPSAPPERILPLSDLVVGVRSDRFYLRSLRLGKEVRVCQNHMLNAKIAPNVARFLLDVSQDGQPYLAPFNWGSAAASPFLPRLVRNQIVVSPAQWNITRSSIVTAGHEDMRAHWITGLKEWRRRWRAPRYLYLAASDNRLLLDLENPLMVETLYREVAQLGPDDHLALQEVLPDFDHLWLRDERGQSYFSEVVVPLVRADATQAANFPESAMQSSQIWWPSRTITRPERNSYPGGSWVYLKLYAASYRHNEFIAGPIREFVTHAQQRKLSARWFYVRYADPEPHIRLRLRAQSEDQMGELLLAALQWSQRQTERGLVSHFCLETYEREVERYGGPEAIECVEQLFFADSQVVSDLVAALYAKKLRTDALGAAVLSLDLLFEAWGYDFLQRLVWARTRSSKYAESKQYRARRRELCALLDSEDLPPDGPFAADRILLRDILEDAATQIRRTRDHLCALEDDGRLWGSQQKIIASCAHMRVNRLLRLDRPQEQTVYAFWRQTLESLRLRHQR